MTRWITKTLTSIALGVAAKTALADFVDDIPALEPNTEETGDQSESDSEKNAEEEPSSEATKASGEKSNKDRQSSTSKTPSQSKGTKSSGTQNSSGGSLGSDIDNHNQEAPVEVQGDVVQGFREEGRLILLGNVQIEQDGAILTSEEAEVFATPGTTKTDRALANGNVKLKKAATAKSPPLRGEADELEFLVPDQLMILKGSPKIWRGEELIQGRVIELNLGTGSVKIRGARGVVKPSSSNP